ncbi:MAG: hypothetical protein IT379_42140 [Deltaproteobacteria bacterium]|nr:hypothetical protein [Deltaproteobacteria bacterium]
MSVVLRLDDWLGIVDGVGGRDRARPKGSLGEILLVQATRYVSGWLRQGGSDLASKYRKRAGALLDVAYESRAGLREKVEALFRDTVAGDAVADAPNELEQTVSHVARLAAIRLEVGQSFLDPPDQTDAAGSGWSMPPKPDGENIRLDELDSTLFYGSFAWRLFGPIRRALGDRTGARTPSATDASEVEAQVIRVPRPSEARGEDALVLLLRGEAEQSRRIRVLTTAIARHEEIARIGRVLAQLRNDSRQHWLVLRDLRGRHEWISQWFAVPEPMRDVLDDFVLRHSADEPDTTKGPRSTLLSWGTYRFAMMYLELMWPSDYQVVDGRPVNIRPNEVAKCVGAEAATALWIHALRIGTKPHMPTEARLFGGPMNDYWANYVHAASESLSLIAARATNGTIARCWRVEDRLQPWKRVLAGG